MRQRAAFSSRRPFFESSTLARNITGGHSGGLFPDLADVAPTLAFLARSSQCGATYRERGDVARLCAKVRPFGPALAFFSSPMRGFSRSLQPWPRAGGGKSTEPDSFSDADVLPRGRVCE